MVSWNEWLYSLNFFYFHIFFTSSFFPFLPPNGLECNLSKDSTTTDDSIDYATCSNKCLNDLSSNMELCSCHQNNEIGENFYFTIVVVFIVQVQWTSICSYINWCRYLAKFAFEEKKVVCHSKLSYCLMKFTVSSYEKDSIKF